MSGALDWLAALAARHGLSYEPGADERWLRAFEPFVTVRTPLRYEHALLSTGSHASISIARMVTAMDVTTPDARREDEVGAWIALVQDLRLEGARAAATNDTDVPGHRRASPFAESSDLVAAARARTGDAHFDRVFASFASSDDEAARAITPSLRKLVLGWNVPVHFEVRSGAFVLAPISLGADPRAVEWLVGAVEFFGEKGAKRVK